MQGRRARTRCGTDLGADKCVSQIYHGWFCDGSSLYDGASSTYGQAPGYLSGGPNEETGLVAAGPFFELTPLRQKSGKTVHAFALEADFDLSAFASNLFEMEWPPHSGKLRSFPEIDRIGWFDGRRALQKLIAYQRPFLVELQARLAETISPPPA